MEIGMCIQPDDTKGMVWISGFYTADGAQGRGMISRQYNGEMICFDGSTYSISHPFTLFKYVFDALGGRIGILVVNAFVVRLHINMFMAMKKIIPLVDGCNFHGIYPHVRTPGACADIRSVLDELNVHATKLTGIIENNPFIG